MNKYTPGPWVYEKHSGIISDTRLFDDRTDVAEVFGNTATSDANATLIAAAPTLLEALESAVAIMKYEWPESQWAEHGIPQLVDIIAKAKGEK